MEAGIGTLTRLGHGQLDAVLIVVEPTPRSIEVGTRAAELAVQGRQGRVVVVANQVSGPEDEAAVRLAFAGMELFVVPADPAIVSADQVGVSPLDASPESPAVRALLGLAATLAQRIPPTADR